MQLFTLKTEHPRKFKKARIGRGGKRGYSSGRGQKGQGSRAGHRIRPAERDLIIRLPKLRGYKNKPLRTAEQIVKIGSLNVFTGIVTPEILFKSGLIRNPRALVKILGGGVLKSKVTVQNITLSAGARKSIEAVGGSVKLSQ